MPVDLCPRCTLRKNGEGDPNEYIKSSECLKIETNPELKSEIESENPDKLTDTPSPTEQHCFGCMGLLQPTYLKKLITTIEEKITEWSQGETDVKRVSIAIHPPISVLAINKHLDIPGDSIELHVIARIIINAYFNQKYEDTANDVKSDLEIQLRFEHVESEKEVLSPLFSKNPSIMKKLKNGGKFSLKSKNRDGSSQDVEKGYTGHKRLKSEFYTEQNIYDCLRRLHCV